MHVDMLLVNWVHTKNRLHVILMYIYILFFKQMEADISNTPTRNSSIGDVVTF